MKKQIRMTESELHRLIESTVKNVLNEGIGWSNQTYDLLEDLKERLGADNLLNEICGKIAENELFNILTEIDGIYSEEEENY